VDARARGSRSSSIVAAGWMGVVAVSVSCADPPEPARSPRRVDEVPANSLDRTRLEPASPASSTRAGSPAPHDPSQPYTVRVGESPPPPPASVNPGARSTDTAGAISKADCDRVMDRYLDLEIRTNPSLASVGPEVIAAAKQMARDKHGEAPCTATRSQYACAMAASTTEGWQRCMR
jgi:hypothetical protein